MRDEIREAIRKIRRAEKPLTNGETLEAAMSARDEEEAQAMLAALEAYQQKHHGCNAVEAYDLVRKNIGYYAGYYDQETRKRAYGLYGTSHPIFSL
ncbi:MAG: hypothetical protein CYG60_02555 [Actinobacteria bacterium]|nr:MAG: hypothetical protein CYG60_02555 [Actinomycetota bacterium]